MSKREQDCFLEGYIAYLGNKPISEIPYGEDTQDHVLWLRGWYRAHFEGAARNVSI